MTDQLADAPRPRSWRVPTAVRPLSGEVVVPGSKSVTNRALLLAALGTGPSLLRAPLRSRDTELMAAALRGLGTDVAEVGPDWAVTPRDLRGPAEVDAGLAGTVMRFVPAVATLATGDVHVDGDARARERPLAPLIAALRRLGADIDDAGRGALPVTVHGTGGIAGGEVDIDASASSQLLSALLLPAARWGAGVRVRHVGTRAVPNAPHVRMTVEMLRERGVPVGDDRPGVWVVQPAEIAGRDEEIEPDLSSAAPFLAAALVTGGEVRTRWKPTSCQPGAELPTLLSAFGARTHLTDGVLTVSGGEVTGATLDLRNAGELTPVLAAVAAVAGTPSTLTGIGYLRGHETDRLAALARELTGLGASVQELADGLTISPGPLTGGPFHSYADHRLVMAAAVIGLVVPGVEVDDASAVTKTYPDFVEQWSEFVGGAAS
ncbi:MAG TPA: 3-phosphoshikimate 1-carboxyvinyltransferase [Mycobacteriales bacterium]|nr:3-phosphoshikimate 1-carboxyvinyltransferase [Mycobacteriales bacterium]